jgi:hypothetical protein
MEIMFTIVPVIIGLGFVFMIFTFIKNNTRNTGKPKVAAPATIVAKRQELSTQSDSHYTWHYVTFEFETRDRIELSVDSLEYGLMVENDKGMLTFQGDKFIGFERTIT